jgi:hypothetical protein
VAPQQSLDVCAFAGADGVELRDDLASAHDREVLTSVLYGVEDVGEVPGCIGSAHLRHEIRLSDRDVGPQELRQGAAEDSSEVLGIAGKTAVTPREVHQRRAEAFGQRDSCAPRELAL